MQRRVAQYEYQIYHKTSSEAEILHNLNWQNCKNAGSKKQTLNEITQCMYKKGL